MCDAMLCASGASASLRSGRRLPFQGAAPSFQFKTALRSALRSPAEESLKAPLPSLCTQSSDSSPSPCLTMRCTAQLVWRPGCSSLASFLGFGNRKRKRPSSALLSLLCLLLHDREDA